jgi:trans-aconitate methyltransferase
MTVPENYDGSMREWNAEAYHRVSNPQFDWGTVVLERLPLDGDETVLDIGCGTGRLTDKLLERLPRGRVIAIDLSANMIQTARDYLRPRHQSRVQLAIADAAALPLDESCDAIFSTATFHWVLDHPQLFRSLGRAMKPGARLVAQCGGRQESRAHSPSARSPAERCGVRALLRRVARPVGVRRCADHGRASEGRRARRHSDERRGSHQWSFRMRPRLARSSRT